MRQRLQSFFYSRPNLAGLVLAFGGLALYAFGVIGAPAWIPVTLGLYALGYVLMPDKPVVTDRIDASASEVDIRDGLTRLVHGLRGKVADDLYAKAWSIRKSIVATLDVEAGERETDPNVYLIRQTALSYLPDAFATYLRVPRMFAEHRPLANGRTPHDVLLEQLDLMDRRLADVADDILRNDSDKLLANGRFLAEKFGTSSLQLDTTPTPETLSEPAEVRETTPVPETAEEAEQVAERERVH